MRSDAAKGALVGTAFVAVLIGLWEWLGASGDVALTAVLPPPSKFLQTVIDSGFRIGLGGQAAPVWDSVLSTLGRVFVGMALAFVLAVLSGALLSLSKLATWCLRPVLHILAPIAPIAWIPTAIVVFGISNVTAVFIVFMGVYFILTIATLAEIERVPSEYLTVAENLGATPLERWIFVVGADDPARRFHFAADQFHRRVDGRAGGRDGRSARRLGAIIMMGRNLFNNELILFGMVIIGVTGFLVDKLLSLMGARLLWWRT